jgi:long-chain acyl-CoA synthetase
MQLPKLTLNELVKAAVSRYGARRFAAYADRPEEGITYAECAEKILALQQLFAEQGIRSGDRIAILGENQPHWGICYLAVTTYGAVGVPILPDFQSGDIASILQHAEVRGICISRRMEEKHKAVVSDDYLRVGMDDLTVRTREGEERQVDAEHPAAYSGARLAERIPNRAEEEATAVIIYTSGTTGRPKGVVLTHRNIVHNVVSTSYIPVKLRPGDRLLSILPLAHTYECTIGFLTPLLLGCSIYYLRSLPAPRVLLPALKRVRPQVMLSVPLLMEKLYRNMVLPTVQRSGLLRRAYRSAPLRRLIHRIVGVKLRRIFGGKLKYFIIGGAAPSPEVERFLKEARFPLAKGYGLTETSPLVAGCTPAYDRIYTVGTPLRGVSVKIASEDPRNIAGEILVKGPNVTPGYYREEQRSAEAFDREGWFRTGDLGTLDEEGYLSIRGRLKNLILGPSGENIYPEEIENLLYEDEAVSEALVLEEEGRVIARVLLDYDVLREKVRDWADSASDLPRAAGEYLDRLRREVNARLAAFARLAGVKEQPEPFEKTPTNKIKRYLYTDSRNTPRREDERPAGEAGEEPGHSQNRL